MGKSLNILVIEDSKDDVFLLTRELRRNGYSLNYERVYTPNDMQTALKKGQWDVILCDYVMPNFSAPAALEVMKNSGLDLPFIVVSGAMGEESAVAVMRAGAHDYLTKDKLIRLVPAIEREMQEAANRRERRRAVELATQLGRILDNSSNEIYVFDATSFKFTQTNRSARENLGYSEEELAHLTPMALQPQPDTEALIAQFKLLYTRERDEIVYETLFRRRDGSTYPVEARLHLSDSETPPVFVAIARDITERKRSEAALYFLAEASIKLVSELDYGNIFRTVAQLAVPFLADLCIVDVVTEDSLMARVAVIHADPSKVELTQELEKFSPSMGKNHPVIDVIKSGQPFMVSVTTQKFFEEMAQSEEHQRIITTLGMKSYMIVPMVVRERVIGAISLFFSESERYYGPTELALAEELSRRAAVAVENARLYYEAQQALLMRDAFLSIAAHELKTPITALLGNTQLVQRRLARSNGVLVERDQRMLKVIEQQAQRLSRMVETLLDISRIRTGTLSLEQQALDINELARRIVNEMQPSLDQHVINMTGLDEPIIVLGDGLRLEQVFQNLIQNAVKYSPTGGQVRMDITRQKENNCVVISVADDGIGIPAKAMPNLFRQFFRAENTTQHQIAGMGLGLYVVREIVALHGGRVEVESIEGSGSTFRVYLPVSLHEDAAGLSNQTQLDDDGSSNGRRSGTALPTDRLSSSPFPPLSGSDQADYNDFAVTAH